METAFLMAISHLKQLSGSTLDVAIVRNVSVRHVFSLRWLGQLSNEIDSASCALGMSPFLIRPSGGKISRNSFFFFSCSDLIASSEDSSSESDA